MTIEKKILVEGIEKQKERLDKLFNDNALDCILCDPYCFDILDKPDKAELNKKNMEKNFGTFDKDKDSAVYIISAPGFSPSKKDKTSNCFDRLDETHRLFDNLKKEGKIAMCKINDDKNDDNWGKNEEGCLYVGSSHNIMQRIREHLGLAYAGTYAMHLGQWFWELQPKLKVTIEFWKTTKLTNNKKNPAYLQIVEDILWDHYKPLFGKRGPR
jgi:hypothetical protein